jgi:hypothetical protein
MTIPTITFRILDNQLGLLPESSDGLHVVAGVCSVGTVAEIASYSELADLVSGRGYGPAVEAAALSLSTGVNGLSGRPVLVVRINASVAGVAGDVVTVRTSTSTGTVAVSGAPYDRYRARVVITRTGTLGAGAFKYSLDNGENYSAEIALPGGGTYAIPHTNLTLTFTPNGGAIFFEAGDAFSFSTLAPSYATADLTALRDALTASVQEPVFVHVVGAPNPALSAVTSAGTSPPVVTVSGTPMDWLYFKLKITLNGARGTATFQYSLDGGTTYNGTDILTAATYLIPGTNVTVAFATGTNYTDDNTYTFNSAVAPAATMATRATAVDGYATTQEAAAEFLFWLLEAPDASDTDLAAAIASVTSERVAVAAGYCDLISPVDSNTDKRSIAWPYAARIAATPVHEDPGRVASGPLGSVVRLYRDERITPNLDVARFVTARTWRRRNGFFITRGRMLAGGGSDFRDVPNRRVMDLACRVGYEALLRWQSDTLLVDPTNGHLDETSARTVDQWVESALRAALTTPGHASDVQVQTIRTDNLLTTETLRCKLRVIPLAYARFIDAEIALLNPAIQTLTAE